MTGRLVRSVLAGAVAVGAVTSSPGLGAAARAGVRPAAPGPHRTAITVSGARRGPVFYGVGAISGGGGNSRYLIDYPAPEQQDILNYLFTPHYGASLQMLKLEIGGGSNSSDGSEASVEPARGAVNCHAGYEFWLAKQALQRNPAIKLYGLQWGAPGWTGSASGGMWTQRNVAYVIDWLNCARSQGLTISYLGGRDEAGYSRRWYEEMRAALDANGYRKVRLVAADDNGGSRWQVAKALAASKAFDKAVSVVGAHDPCGRGQYACVSSKAARSVGKPLWLSEQGMLDPNANASNEARVINRMYVQGHMTGMLEWSLLNAMPPGLPYENRGLVTADQPWSGSYIVNKQTWATAQTTQFAAPGWRYADGAAKLLGASGSAVAYLSPDRRDWSMVAENTGSAAGQQVKSQRIDVRVAGGLRAKVVRVWTTDLNSMDSGKWFVRRRVIRPVGGRFHYTVPPGYVVTFTTTSGQTKAGGAAPWSPPPFSQPLPYSNTLTTDDGSDEPSLLAPLDGTFGLVRCAAARGQCLQQLTPSTPVLWHSDHLDYPYAIIGDPSWRNYAVSVKALLTQNTGTAGVIGRFTERASRATTPAVGNRVGLFEGYLLDVAADGSWRLLRNTVTSRTPVVLASGAVPPLGVDSWHTLSLSMNGTVISAAIDGRTVGTATDSAYSSGLAGIEAGAFTSAWPIDQYRDLLVTPLPVGTPAVVSGRPVPGAPG